MGHRLQSRPDQQYARSWWRWTSHASPKFISLVLAGHLNPKTIDFGCGTGCNILKLLKIRNATVIGLDAIPKMLDIARHRCQELLASLPQDAGVKEFLCEVYNPMLLLTPPASYMSQTDVTSAKSSLKESFNISNYISLMGFFLLLLVSIVLEKYNFLFPPITEMSLIYLSPWASRLLNDINAW